MRRPGRATWFGSAAVLVAMLALVIGQPGARSGTTVAGAAAAGRSSADVRAFRGLGTWVDVYDYGAKFQGTSSSPPAFTLGSVDDMARLGVKTMYLQAAQDDPRSEGDLVDHALVGQILRRAHRQGVKVVAWYLPHFADVHRDLRYVRALYRFRTHGERFDGIALDLEWTSDVKDPAKRNRAMLSLAKQTRRLVTEVPLGAIVLEPVLIEDVNPALWPGFPWKKLAGSFDVWLPMSYWTNRNEPSGWKDGFRYTSENIRRLRHNLDDAAAAVHVIGGVADQANAGDVEGFVRASEQRHAIGWSMYDYVTTSSAAWPRLRP
ncbi:MAG: hypothetical protein ACXVKA_02325 [Acidimicrobiia bacterium]